MGIQGVSLVLELGNGKLLIVGILFGWLNGLLVAKLNIAPFIATLGMLYVARGFAKLITNGETFTKLAGEQSLGNTGFLTTFAARPFGIPLPIWVMILFAGLLLTAIAYLWMNKLGQIPEQKRIFVGNL